MVNSYVNKYVLTKNYLLLYLILGGGEATPLSHTKLLKSKYRRCFKLFVDKNLPKFEIIFFFNVKSKYICKYISYFLNSYNFRFYTEFSHLLNNHFGNAAILQSI